MVRFLPTAAMSAFATLFFMASSTLAQQNVNIDWRITTYQDQTVKVGDTVTFSWGGSHNVFKNDDQDCNKSSPNAISLGAVSPVTYTFTQDDLNSNGGEVYFACHVGGHCNAGQNILFRVEQDQQQVVQAPPPAVDNNNNGGNNNNNNNNNNGGGGYGYGWGNDNNNNDSGWGNNDNNNNVQDNNNVVNTPPAADNNNVVQDNNNNNVQQNQQQQEDNQVNDVFNNKGRGLLIMLIVFLSFIPVIAVNVYVIFFRNKKNNNKSVESGKAASNGRSYTPEHSTSSNTPNDVLPHYTTSASRGAPARDPSVADRFKRPSGGL